MLKNHPLHLLVYGVQYMNDDPAEVDVLYGKVKDLSEEPVLQELADRIMKYFSKTGMVVITLLCFCTSHKFRAFFLNFSGLMPKQFDAVKLHVTIMNSLFRRDDSDSDVVKGDNPKRVRETFDASLILKVSYC